MRRILHRIVDASRYLSDTCYEIKEIFRDATNAVPSSDEQISIKTESAFEWQLIGARNMIIRTPNAQDVAEEAQ